MQYCVVFNLLERERERETSNDLESLTQLTLISKYIKKLFHTLLSLFYKLLVPICQL